MLSFSLTSFSQHHQMKHDKDQPMNTEGMTAAKGEHIIKVPTVQCGMCKNAIEKGLSGIEGIQSIAVDIKKKEAAVDFDEKLISLTDIESAISKIGYQANDTKADADAYAKLPGCCKMPE